MDFEGINVEIIRFWHNVDLNENNVGKNWQPYYDYNYVTAEFIDTNARYLYNIRMESYIDINMWFLLYANIKVFNLNSMSTTVL